MSTSTKCRARGGPAYCADPNCPERNHRAAREAQAKASFMTTMLQSIGLKPTPSADVIHHRDRLDKSSRRLDELVNQITETNPDVATETRLAKPLMDEEGNLDIDELNRRNRAGTYTQTRFDLGTVTLPHDAFIQVIDIAQKHNVKLTRDGEVESAGHGSIRVQNLSFQGTSANITAARAEIASLLKAKETALDAKRALLDQDITKIDLQRAARRR